jgi:DNA (cytosine-5)-methyltransferase 1
MRQQELRRDCTRNDKDPQAIPSAARNPSKARRPAASAGCGNVVDLFCGAGGLSHGFSREGFHIAAGIDVDERCRYPFEFNNRAPFIRADVKELGAAEVAKLFSSEQTNILVGCAPCQPFSIYNQKNADPQWQLLGQFSRIISELKPPNRFNGERSQPRAI